MARYRIGCINKSNRQDRHEAILNVGGVSSGTPWKISQAAAVAHIDSGTHTFYVLVSGNEAEVITAVSPYGHRYLKTKADTTTVDNLLSLPECP